ncbi:hypothetical protein FHS25_000562 [Rhizobium laguerreae]|uniref:Uncharacterized protein n=1 Tax=Rhizobium laguerreae TaxID=1076926 RepID=A0AAX2QQ62_9HYPH|nr:hypothetical protein [Rhizobium laguerreae]TCU28299.1 hypothetical protein EV131_102131 [Rhizobium laguerreae]
MLLRKADGGEVRGSFMPSLCVLRIDRINYLTKVR